MTPRVSVVIPTYNRPHLLPRAVEAALGQTAAADCEILVVDDGGDVDLHRLLAPHAARLRLIRRENGGLAAARNTGIAAARGEFIALLDDDDAWHPGKIERQLAALDRHRAAVLCTTRTDNVAPDGTRTARRLPPIAFDRPVDCLSALLEWNFVPPSSTLIRRSVLARIGGFAAHLRQAEDYDLWTRLAAQGPFVCLAETLTLYAVATPGSLSGNSLRQMQYEQLARRRMRRLAGSRPERRAAWRRGWIRCQTDLRDAAFSSGRYGLAFGAAVRAAVCDPMGRAPWEWRRMVESLGAALGLIRRPAASPSAPAPPVAAHRSASSR